MHPELHKDKENQALPSRSLQSPRPPPATIRVGQGLFTGHTHTEEQTFLVRQFLMEMEITLEYVPALLAVGISDNKRMRRLGSHRNYITASFPLVSGHSFTPGAWRCFP